ncbi:hypothetical protein RIR_jg2445.t1 [Rhizophagus irregularis DAOM 181602=DAOM 197198]|nr:hypothetical protein RIR_jg2445.t1 [Rhizophagus irregularis DAOM 181602=DAOM 197198]
MHVHSRQEYRRRLCYETDVESFTPLVQFDIFGRRHQALIHSRKEDFLSAQTCSNFIILSKSSVYSCLNFAFLASKFLALSIVPIIQIQDTNKRKFPTPTAPLIILYGIPQDTLNSLSIDLISAKTVSLLILFNILLRYFGIIIFLYLLMVVLFLLQVRVGVRIKGAGLSKYKNAIPVEFPNGAV